MRRTFLVIVLLVAVVCLRVAAGPAGPQQPQQQQRKPLPFTADPSIPLELAFRLDDVLFEAEKLRLARQFAAARERLEAIALYKELNNAIGLSMSYNNLVYLSDDGPEEDTVRQMAIHYAREAKDLVRVRRPARVGR